MVSRMVVGKRFGGATTKDENEGNDNCRKALRDFFHLSGTFVVSDAQGRSHIVAWGGRGPCKIFFFPIRL